MAGPSSSSPKITKIARYEIIRELGRGGMATVYLARDPNFQREVAIKVLPRETMHDSTLYQRFQREARTIASLEHPAIVPVHDFGEEDGQPFLVQRYLSGGSLSARIKAGPLPIHEAAKVLIRVGGALDAAHAKGIVHRDLKPANILFDERGDAYLSDFGIAQLSESTSPLTGSAILGTPAYMSPEQIRGDGKIDGRADIYALGIVLFEMLTGKTPFKADTPAQMMMAHLANPTPRLPEEKKDLPDTINGVLIRAMAKDPELRFQKASELGNLLAAIASGQAPVFMETSQTYRFIKETSATRIDAEDGGPRKPGRTVKRQLDEDGSKKPTTRWPLIAAAVVAFLCICGIGGSVVGYSAYTASGGTLPFFLYKETSVVTPSNARSLGTESTSSLDSTRPVNTTRSSGNSVPTVAQNNSDAPTTAGQLFIVETDSDISDIAWSPDGTMLAVAGNGDGGIRIWDTSKWQVQFILQGHNGKVKQIDWSPDSKTLASLGANDEDIIFWDIASQSLYWREEFIGINNVSIRDLDWSPDGKFFATSDNFDLILWNTQDLKTYDSLSLNTSLATFISFSPDSSRIAYTTSSGTVEIRDIASKEVIYDFRNENIDYVASLEWTADGTKIAIGGTQSKEGMIQQVWIWDLTTKQVMIPKKPSKYEGMIVDFVLCSNGMQFASASSDLIILWDPATSQPWNAYSLSDTGIGSIWIQSISPSPEGNHLAIGLQSGKIVIWDIPLME